ncbi:Putative uncharacterized protein [Taphrina deformans PYCC 5710]|uniref:Histone deacetylase domain-containing protein n=1 Tax=Taphrina deformans (strain PYCC 5710 / ATCC 11124 / CBS 356.35 / IMI 108563 / JCM 9778 / NBRC 8474) TaxID=1097556 RepID=R4XAD7_TAPDE|nr:Putative uncharacterized protein [Taphrina deformans PYCC 5710]|eukprot:CCG81234.1 Putative uncharacterized protein [Taphrina deformans PYCC 5710]
MTQRTSDDPGNESFDIARALLDLSIGTASQGATSQDLVNATQKYTTPQKQEIRDIPTATFITPTKQDVERQVDSLATTGVTNNTCLVVLQDSCELHKFSRNIRQKDLETIVERPQRTKAAILGIINAKARLENAGRPSLDILHSQRIGNLGDAAVEDVHGLIYPQDLLRMSHKVEEKLAKGDLEISQDLPYGDLYLAPRSIDALNGCIGALYDGMDALFAVPKSPDNPLTSLNRSYNSVHVCIRPPGHHAAEISPCGFCWINNVHIAIAYARRHHGIKRAAILDFDLHHGDGSQSIAWSINETTPSAIGYYSLHDIYSFPCEAGNVDKIKEASVNISAHGHNIHNIALEPFKDLDDFDRLYQSKYSKLFEAAEEYLAEGSAKGEKSLICISAGYDASEHESAAMQRHAVSVPTTFYERFTRDATALAQKYCKSKIFSVMEGGYGDRAIVSASTAHLIGLVQESVRDEMISSCYNLAALQILEKNYLKKVRRGRDSGLIDGVRDPWLVRMDVLRDNHLNVPISENTKVEGEQLILADLQRMTLRDRKPRSTPVATPRAVKATPKSTPFKSNEGHASVRNSKPSTSWKATSVSDDVHVSNSQPVVHNVNAQSAAFLREPVIKPEAMQSLSIDGTHRKRTPSAEREVVEAQPEQPSTIDRNIYDFVVE